MANILIENEQNKVDFKRDLYKVIENAVLISLEQLGFEEDCEISVIITDNDKIRQLNKQYRGKDMPTDVLSFPMLKFDENRKMIRDGADYAGDCLILGDIVISLERAKEQAEQYGHSLEREVGFLTVHSMLHLFGYDHMDESEGVRMRAKEEEILEKMGLRRD